GFLAQKDDGRTDAHRAEPAQELDAGHAGKRDIRDHAAEPIAVRCEVALGAIEVLNVDIERAEQESKRMAVRCVRFDHCNDGTCARHGLNDCERGCIVLALSMELARSRDAAMPFGTDEASSMGRDLWTDLRPGEVRTCTEGCGASRMPVARAAARVTSGSYGHVNPYARRRLAVPASRGTSDGPRAPSARDARATTPASYQ